ncbi:MAG: DUF1737 domain-containing protein [Jannaschia sp.]
MTTLYRTLTGEDDATFCHKVSEALSKGWVLHGAPAYAWDHREGLMRCCQAVTKEVEVPYSINMKLGAQ